VSDLVKREEVQKPAVSYPAFEAETRFDLARLLRRLLRRKYEALIVALLVVIPAAISTYLATPLYRSTLILQIDPVPVRVLPYQDVATSETSGNYELYMRTQDEILKSPTLMSRVATRLAEQGVQPNDLKNGYGVQRIASSQLVTLSFSDPNPEVAAKTVNTFAEEYIKLNFEAKQEMVEKAKAFLSRELRELKQKAEASERELVQYAQSTGLNLQPGQVDLVQNRLAFVSTQLSSLETELLAAKFRRDGLRAVTPEHLPQELLTKEISELNNRLIQLEQQRTALLTKFDENWPEVIRNKEETELVKQQLKREQEKALQQVRQQAELEYSAIEGRYKALSQALKEQEDLVHRLNQASIQFNVLKREVDTNQQLYDGLMERFKQANITAGTEFGNLHVVTPGKPAAKPYYPNVAWNLALASLLGLALGLSFAVARDYWDDSITSLEEAEHFISLPALGFVPRSEQIGAGFNELKQLPEKTSETSGETVSGLAIQHNGNSKNGSGLPPAVNEAFRTICASILLSSSDTVPRTILVCSAEPGEGKTTLVAHLGRALAASRASTVLLEFDLRRPTLMRQLGLKNGSSRGLSTFLAGHTSPKEFPAVYRTGIDNLFAIEAGPKPPNPLALLRSERLDELLKTLRSHFKFVIVDSPPLLTVADARVLSRKVEGVVLVIRAGKTSQKRIKQARNQLESAGAKILGMVLNGTDKAADSYYYYDERYYTS